ncbi:S-layer homology domain-containing protein [Inediibacterium massiliense]|uniref:S-layer homology domain-containing protein n=1 Tax=Inediibacterium massiliense TaxID=1658111 RepID=UPI0006B4854C|nr:S-layer homology domain-containing protein [Inediibacterium massiliense]
MKKMIVFCMVCSLLFMSVQPMNAFAQEDVKLEKAIQKAKEVFDIPQEFTEFEYDVSSSNNGSEWNMQWYSKDQKEGRIKVSVDERGNIISYYKNKRKEIKNQLPIYNKNQGKKIAEDFIKKVDENLFTQLIYEDNTRSGIQDTYYYDYIRKVNEIPFYEDCVSVGVNSYTGEIESFYKNWSNHISFPKSENILSIEDAKKAFKKELGLELAYRYKYEQDQVKPYLVYATKYETDYAIDAITGKKIKIASPIMYKSAMDQSANLEAGTSKNEISLNPEELKAVKEAEKLMSKKDVEQIARDEELLGITKDMKLSFSNIYKDWPMKDSFIWKLSFENPKDEKHQYVSVEIDAFSGKIKSFYIDNHEENKKPAYDQEYAKKEVEEFLKNFIGDQYAQTTYKENIQDEMIMKNEKLPYYDFSYVRKIHGVPFDDNGIHVRFNAITGKIQSFDIRWFDISFKAPNQLVSIDQLYNKLFEDIGFTLRYKQIRVNSQQNNEIKLVYGIDDKKPAVFDAHTGAILKYNGEPYEEKKKILYKDVEGHKAQKEIEALKEYNIGFKEENFRPNDQMTQKDFLYLLAQALSPYGEYDDTNQMYEELMRQNIIKEEEKRPNEFLTKEESVKFIIRALKYDDIGKIKGIYKYPFTDEKSANPDLMGHISIAYGLGIVKGENGVFDPKGKISRGDGAVEIYNYLQKSR